MRTLRSLYFGIELRTLAVMRFGLGSLLFLDLAKRSFGAAVWYTNSGLLPTHRELLHPRTPYQFSYFFSLWTLQQVRVAFALTAVIYLCFLVGYRTRLFHVLSWISLLSLQTRTSIIANGGDYVFCTLLLWTAFLPLGRRWSLDAWLAQAGEGSTVSGSGSEHVESLAAMALRAQLMVIYLFNALNKTGETWTEGSAVHYLLHQARIVTLLGVWMREHAPASLLRTLAYGTLAVEYLIPLLIAIPWFRPWPRRLAIVLIYGFHSGIALLSNLGLFSPVMMVFALCLLDADDFRWLGARGRLSSVAAQCTAWLSDQRARLRMYAAQPTPNPRQLTQLGSRVRSIAVWLREAVVMYLIVCASSQLVYENGEVLAALEHERPRAVRATVEYLRLNQGWAMFAPDAPRSDWWLVVDAQTSSGRHIDPFNQRASNVANPQLRAIPARLNQDVYFCNYTGMITGEHDLHAAFRAWILSHGARAHRPDERVLRFDAYEIEQLSPPLGQVHALGATVRRFLSGESSHRQK